MKYLLVILLPIIWLTSSNLKTQDSDIEAYNKEKQAILNVVINSIPFDSVYTSKQIYFEANELLSEGTSLILERGEYKAKIMQSDYLNKNKLEYLVLGDFTMAINNPTRVRVQMETIPNYHLLNLILEKKDSLWVIVNHLIITE